MVLDSSVSSEEANGRTSTLSLAEVVGQAQSAEERIELFSLVDELWCRK